jgi:inorganic pyrophosphatase
MSETLRLACSFLGRDVAVVVDRPLGSMHPEHGFRYELNYGYVPGTLAADREELDAYLVGIDTPVEHGTGLCTAVINRFHEEDDKLVVETDGAARSDAELISLTAFQERAGGFRILRSDPHGSPSGTHPISLPRGLRAAE